MMTMKDAEKPVKEKILAIREQTERIASVIRTLGNIRDDIVTDYVAGTPMIDMQKASPVE